MRPGVAEAYLKEVVADFEKFAKDKYLPVLRSANADQATLLAALRYVATRKVAGHESSLREIYTTRHKGKVGAQVSEAALDALLETAADREATARFLVLAASAADPVPVVRVSLNGLQRLGKPTARRAMLAELREGHSPDRLVAIVQLLADDTRISSPIPLPEWRKADGAARAEAVDTWQSRIEAAGGLRDAP